MNNAAPPLDAAAIRIASNARRRDAAAALREIRQRRQAAQEDAYTVRREQRARVAALAEAVDMDTVAHNYTIASATEEDAWQSKAGIQSLPFC